MKISQAKFAGSSTRTSQRPKLRLPEFAFIGRSNVGKSSLINMLCSNGKLALTSSTPGKTKLVNHFEINGKWYLVDLPGYGFAKMPLKQKEALTEVIRDYLNHSEELRMLFILVDCRHDMQKIDLEFIEEIQGSDIPYGIIFTKGDKMGPVARQKQVDKNIERIIEYLLEVMPDTVITFPHFQSSAQTNLGRDEILSHIESILESKEESTKKG